MIVKHFEFSSIVKLLILILPGYSHIERLKEMVEREREDHENLTMRLEQRIKGDICLFSDHGMSKNSIIEKCADKLNVLL